MKETLFLACITLSTLILLSANQYSLALGSQVGDDLIQETCNRSRYHDLCVSALQSDPRSSSADVNGLAHIMLELSLSNATDTLAYVRKLKNETTDPVIMSCLEVCEIEYDKAVVEDIPGAIRAFESKAYKNALVGAGGLINNAETCESTFVDPPILRKSPLTDRNQASILLPNIAGDIIVIIGGHF